MHLKMQIYQKEEKMYIDFISDWPAYLFMALFIIFFIYLIIKGNSKTNAK
jgi:hypothetical protein